MTTAFKPFLFADNIDACIHTMMHGDVVEVGGERYVRVGTTLHEFGGSWHETEAAALRAVAEHAMRRAQRLQEIAAQLESKAAQAEASCGASG